MDQPWVGNGKVPKAYSWLLFLNNPWLLKFCTGFRITQHCNLNAVTSHSLSCTQGAQNFINVILRHFDFAEVAGTSSLRPLKVLPIVSDGSDGGQDGRKIQMWCQEGQLGACWDGWKPLTLCSVQAVPPLTSAYGRARFPLLHQIAFLHCC